MQERNIISGATSAFLAPLMEGWEQLSMWLILAVVLLIADLRYGLKAAKQRGENIRRSRAVRRSINKLVDYFCWLSIAWCIGHTFGSSFNVPILAVVVLAVIYGVEIASIVDNYFEYKGINKRVNLGKLFGRIFRKYDLEGVIEDKKEEGK